MRRTERLLLDYVFIYRQRCLACKTIEEMEQVREEYFDLPYGIETLEEHWDEVAVGEYRAPILRSTKLKTIS